jgi:hypothetical protein
MGGGGELIVTPDVAYDYVHDRYFGVHGHGFIQGELTDINGNLIAANITINSNLADYAQTPRVAFSPDVNGGAGGYLVTWHETMPGGFASVHARLVTADGVPFGGDIVVSPEAVSKTSSTNWTMGAAVAYSTASQEFLVAWMGSYTITNDIRAMRLNAAGALLQASYTPITTASPDWERDPDVAYNPDTNEFFIVYAGFHNIAAYAYVAGQRVQAGTGLMLGGPVEYDAIGGSRPATYVPAVAYNTYSKQYLAVWYHGTNTFAAFYGIKINPDGTAASGLIAESSVYYAYDALGLKYNKVSGDYVLVTHSRTYEDAAISITANGTPYDNGIVATFSPPGSPGTKGNFNPRVTASTKSPTWLMVTASGFAFMGAQFLQSSATPPGPTSTPVTTVEGPSSGSNVSQSFNVTGYAMDLGSQSGTGVSDVEVWAWPVNGSAPSLLGTTRTFSARTDIAAQFGQQFLNSGFSVPVHLPAGAYGIIAYGRSTMTDTYNASSSVAVRVAASGGTGVGADFDGDARGDLTVYSPTTGLWATLLSGTNFNSAAGAYWGGVNYTAVPGDYDGDGKADPAVYNSQTGDWFVLLSSTGFTSALARNCGGPGWTPVPADYDGDGKTDFAVYSQATGLWFGLKSSTGYTTVVAAIYGGPGWMAVPGDYDGDGKADIGVYQQSTGMWSVLLSSSGYTSTLVVFAGGAGWLPVQADYDGDNKTDPAVYNPATGVWFGLKSSSGYVTSVSVAWGGGSFTPVRGDFDGDGKADIAVYDTTTGLWAILLSGSGYTTTIVKFWGGADYVPSSKFF